jgi:outer membrane immunogenic protein
MSHRPKGIAMLRKLLSAACLFLAGLSSAFADSFYVAPSIVYQTFAASGIGYNGIAPRLTLGYEDMLTPLFYAAAEIFSNPTTFKVYNNPTNLGSLRATYSYGASVIPGVNFDNTIIGYGRLGLIRTRFDNLGKVKSGAEYGLGVQWLINCSWSARAEYSYAKYNNITNIGHPDSNTYMIGLMYRFA